MYLSSRKISPQTPQFLLQSVSYKYMWWFWTHNLTSAIYLSYIAQWQYLCFLMFQMLGKYLQFLTRHGPYLWLEALSTGQIMLSDPYDWHLVVHKLTSITFWQWVSILQLTTLELVACVHGCNFLIQSIKNKNNNNNKKLPIVKPLV